MIKALLAVVVLAYAFGARAEMEFSRWTTAPLDAADRLMAGGPGASTVVLSRRLMGPLRSFDGGRNWSALSIGGADPGPVKELLDISTVDGMDWYLVSDADGFLYRTLDGGNTWGKRSGPPAAPFGRSSISVSADRKVLYQALLEVHLCDMLCAPKETHLQVSKDGGYSWANIGTAQKYQEAVASPVDARLVYSTGAGGLFRSDNQGSSWRQLAIPGLELAMVATGKLVLDRQDSQVAYLVLGGRILQGESVYSTRDGGNTWTTSSILGGDLYVDPDTRGRAFVFAHFGAAYETRDAGISWTQVEPGNRSSVDSGVDAVVVREGQRVALNAGYSELRELDLSAGAVALRSDLWWNPAESGMGITITHHGSNKTFITWYAYDESGAPVWRVVPDGTWSDRTFAGDVYETTGAAYFGVAFDPSKVVARKVGTAQFRFDNQDSASFSYQLAQGGSTSKQIVRQLFGPPVATPAVEQNYSDLWWNAAESGWGIAINHQHDNVFATWYVYDAQGKPYWVVMPDAKVALTASSSGSSLPVARGDVYVTRGPPSTGPFDPKRVTASKVGTAALTFAPSGNAVLEYTVSGRAGSKAITRQSF